MSDLLCQKQKMPRHIDKTKYTGEEFIDYVKIHHPNSKYIIANIGYHHMTTFGDLDNSGVKCIDIWDCTDRCVGNYWVKEW